MGQRDTIPGAGCEAVYSFLTIDHVNGNGSQDRAYYGGGQAVVKYLYRTHRQTGSFPGGYQVLCF